VLAARPNHGMSEENVRNTQKNHGASRIQALGLERGRGRTRPRRLAADPVRLADVDKAGTDTAAALGKAEEVEQAAQSVLLATDEVSDNEVGAVLDEIWNELGRPGSSQDYDLIAGSGKARWTNGDPAKQHHLMRILATNITATTAPKLQAKKSAWADRITLKAAAQAEAAKPLEPAEALVLALGARYRALANAAQVGLMRLKRDYKNAGMTEAQIHEIIPDTPRARKTAPGEPPGTPPGTTPA
jgi:hypothetical protein